MGSGSGGQAAMTVIWVVLALLAMGGVMAFSLWRRRGQRTGAGKARSGQ